MIRHRLARCSHGAAFALVLTLVLLTPLLVLPGPAAADDPLATFSPRQGPGYDDYAINGETVVDQYRSFLRSSGVRIIAYAAARVATDAAGWTPGNGQPIGLGDMSESDGSIPSTSGLPDHPAGTHENGLDIDVAYYQDGPADNHLRPVCPTDGLHCTGDPTTLDVRRTALFVAALASTNAIRVIGVDGEIGPEIEDALVDLCTDGVADACGPVPLAYEVVDEGLGWFNFHHHHMHVSFKASVDNTAPTVTITTPADDAVYEPGQVVTADYACDDDLGSAGVECTGPVTDGASLPTSAPGPHTFTVTGVDLARNPMTVTHDYTVRDRRPDAHVRRGTGAWAGDDRYNSTGQLQTVNGSAARGAVLTYTVRVQNDGNAAERLAVRGQGTTSAFRVTYRSGTTDVTSAVTAGTFRTPVLAPGASRSLQVTVRVLANAPRGALVTRAVTVRSTAAPDLLDVVKIVARRA